LILIHSAGTLSALSWAFPLFSTRPTCADLGGGSTPLAERTTHNAGHRAAGFRHRRYVTGVRRMAIGHIDFIYLSDEEYQRESASARSTTQQPQRPGR
jgi:hypothetical protein